MAPEIAKPGIARIRSHMVVATNSALPPATTFLHSNESAFGPGPHAQRAMRAAVQDIERYIEDSHSFLAPHLSARYGPAPAANVYFPPILWKN